MTGGALFWFIVYGLSTAIFFVIAVAVAIRGIGELKNLLGWAEKERTAGERGE